MEELFNLDDSADALTWHLEYPLMPPPPLAPDLSFPPCGIHDFVSQFPLGADGKPRSGLAILLQLADEFPSYIYMDGNEVCMHRNALISARRDLNFTSFERGLKHAGLCVTATTHGGASVKRWTKKREESASPMSIYDGHSKKIKLN